MVQPSHSNTSPSVVAAYFLWLAEHEAEPEYLTPLRLQKLLYYAQGWALAEWGAPLFGAPIEAWPLGPVVSSVYQEFKGWGMRPIVRDGGDEPPVMSDQEKELIRAVWDEYKRYSATGLSEMTHEERPWLEARGDLPAEAKSSRRLSLKTMAETFAAKVSEAGDGLWAQWPDVESAARENTRKLTGRDVI